MLDCRESACNPASLSTSFRLYFAVFGFKTNMNSIERIRRSMQRRKVEQRNREHNAKQIYASVRSYPGSKDCSMCQKTILSEALALPCRHTVCKHCLSNINNRRSKGCPKCRPQTNQAGRSRRFGLLIESTEEMDDAADEYRGQQKINEHSNSAWKFLSCCTQSTAQDTMDFKRGLRNNSIAKKVSSYCFGVSQNSCV